MTDTQRKAILRAMENTWQCCGNIYEATVEAAKDRDLTLTETEIGGLMFELHEIVHTKEPI